MIAEMQDGPAKNNVSTSANGLKCQKEMLLGYSMKGCSWPLFNSKLLTPCWISIGAKMLIIRNLNACVHTHMSTSYIMYT